MKRILIVGAGVSGLSSAVCIQRTLPDVNVTLMSEHFPPEDIVSMVAGGLVLVAPRPNLPSDAMRIVADSVEYFEGLHRLENDLVTGVKQRKGYYLIHTETYGETLSEDLKPLVARISSKCHLLTANECLGLMAEDPCSGWQMESLVVDGRRYLLYLLNTFSRNGGKIKRGRLHSFDQVSKDFDVIVNCTGLGSRDVVSDKTLWPVRGHLMRFSTEGKVNHWVHCNTKIDKETGIGLCFYMIPHSNDTVAGGTYEFHCGDQGIDERRIKLIEKYARRAHSAMQSAQVTDRRVGLRPGRATGWRIEREKLRINGKSITIIHNYGHEGSGVGLSWGSAMKVTRLLSEYLAENKSKL